MSLCNKSEWTAQDDCTENIIRNNCSVDDGNKGKQFSDIRFDNESRNSSSNVIHDTNNINITREEEVIAEQLVQRLHLHLVLAASCAALLRKNASDGDSTTSLPFTTTTSTTTERTSQFIFPTIFQESVLSETFTDFADILVDGRSALGHMNVLGTAKLIWSEYKEQLDAVPSDKSHNIHANTIEPNIYKTLLHLFDRQEEVLNHISQNNIIAPFMTLNALREKRVLLYLYVLQCILVNHHTLHVYNELSDKDDLSSFPIKSKDIQNNNEKIKGASHIDQNERYGERSCKNNNNMTTYSICDRLERFIERLKHHPVCVEMGLIIASSPSNAELIANEVNELCSLCQIDVIILQNEEPALSKGQLETCNCLERDEDQLMKQEIHSEERSQRTNKNASCEVEHNVSNNNTNNSNIIHDKKNTSINSQNVQRASFNHVHFRRPSLCITTLDELCNCDLVNFIQHRANIDLKQFCTLFLSRDKCTEQVSSMQEEHEQNTEKEENANGNTETNINSLSQVLTSTESTSNSYLRVPIHLAAIAVEDALCVQYSDTKENTDESNNKNINSGKNKTKKKQSKDMNKSGGISNIKEAGQAKLESVLHKIINLTTRSFNTSQHTENTSTNAINNNINDNTYNNGKADSNSNENIDESKANKEEGKIEASEDDMCEVNQVKQINETNEYQEDDDNNNDLGIDNSNMDTSTSMDNSSSYITAKAREESLAGDMFVNSACDHTAQTSNNNKNNNTKEEIMSKSRLETLYKTLVWLLDVPSTQQTTYASSFHLIPHFCMLVNASLLSISPLLRCQLSRKNRRYYPLQFDVHTPSLIPPYNHLSSWEECSYYTSNKTRERQVSKLHMTNNVEMQERSPFPINSSMNSNTTTSHGMYSETELPVYSVRPLYLLSLSEHDKLEQILSLLEEDDVAPQHLYKRVLILTHQREVQTFSYRINKYFRVPVFYYNDECENNDKDDDDDFDSSDNKSYKSNRKAENANYKTSSAVNNNNNKKKAGFANVDKKTLNVAEKIDLIKRVARPRLFHLHRSELLERVYSLQLNFFSPRERAVQTMYKPIAWKNNSENDESVMLTSASVTLAYDMKSETNTEGKSKNEVNYSSMLHTPLMSVLVSWNGCTAFDLMDMDCVVFHTPTGQALNQETWKEMMHILHTTIDGELEIELRLREELSQWINVYENGIFDMEEDEDCRSKNNMHEINNKIAFSMALLNYNLWHSVCESKTEALLSDKSLINRTGNPSLVNKKAKAASLESILQLTRWAERRRNPINLVLLSSLDELRSVHYFMSLYYPPTYSPLPCLLNIKSTHPLFTTLVHNTWTSKKEVQGNICLKQEQSEQRNNYATVRNNNNANITNKATNSSSSDVNYDDKTNSKSTEQVLTLSDVIKIKRAKQQKQEEVSKTSNNSNTNKKSEPEHTENKTFYNKNYNSNKNDDDGNYNKGSATGTGQVIIPGTFDAKSIEKNNDKKKNDNSYNDNSNQCSGEKNSKLCLKMSNIALNSKEAKTNDNSNTVTKSLAPKSVIEKLLKLNMQIKSKTVREDANRIGISGENNIANKVAKAVLERNAADAHDARKHNFTNYNREQYSASRLTESNVLYAPNTYGGQVNGTSNNNIITYDNVNNICKVNSNNNNGSSNQLANINFIDNKENCANRDNNKWCIGDDDSNIKREVANKTREREN